MATAHRIMKTDPASSGCRVTAALAEMDDGDDGDDDVRRVAEADADEGPIAGCSEGGGLGVTDGDGDENRDDVGEAVDIHDGEGVLVGVRVGEAAGDAEGGLELPGTGPAAKMQRPLLTLMNATEVLPGTASALNCWFSFPRLFGVWQG